MEGLELNHTGSQDKHITQAINQLSNWKGVNHLFTVSSEVYRAFQECSGDFNPLHTDEEFARSKGFPDKVMYGNILNVFVSTLVGECLPTKDVMIQSQELQFKRPVFMNDELTATMNVESVHESVNTVIFKFSFRNQCQKVVAKGKVQIGII